MDWGDLKYIVEFRRGGTLAAAATRLGIDATTVARRLRTVEAALGMKMVERGGDGSLVLTDAGHKAADRGERVEQIVSDLEVDLTDEQNSIAGLVRMSAVPVLVNRLLIPEAQTLSDGFPGLVLDLDSENRNVSLVNRETDVALRLARPVDGGHSLKTQRISVMEHAVYVAADVKVEQAESMTWIGYQETMHDLPHARWMQRSVVTDGGEFGPIRVCDLGGAIEGIVAGLGKSVVPRLIADRDPRLNRVSDPLPDLFREVWIVYRSEDDRLARIQVIRDWLTGLFKR